MLCAANANLELLEIMGSVVEKLYHTTAVTESEDSTVMELDQSGTLSRELLQWEMKWPIFAQIANKDTATHIQHHTK